jgi:hypothetical protein
MVVATRKRSRSSLVKQENIGHAIALLQDLPEKPKEDLSLREAIVQMQESIRATLAKGYSYDEISKMLSDRGIKISALTLKNYAPSGKRQASKTKKRQTRKSASDAPVAEETATSEMVTAPKRGRRKKVVEEVAAPSEATSSTTTEAPVTKPRRGRRSVATAKVEEETSVKPTRARRSAAPKSTTRSSTARKPRRSKASS